MKTHPTHFSWNDRRQRDTLPIDSHLDTILSALQNHPVVICEAGTGAGKTTRIPQAALLSDQHLKIIMTQPRRHACRWIGRRIAAELGTQPGGLVGWTLLDESMRSRRTRLELMVDQSLINRIIYQKQLPKGLIIIDEAHERSVSIDILLGLIKEKLANSPNTRVLVTSATIDTKKFSEFFNKAPVVTVPGRCFPVSTKLLPLQQNEHHTEGALRAAKQLVYDFFANQLTIADEHHQQQLVQKGVVLILLPGKEDIEITQRQLLDTVSSVPAKNLKKIIEVFSCHGASSIEERDRIQTMVPENTLRFICCTELLRASVTVPGTIGVIDSLQVKRLVTNSEGVACLDKVPVSRAEADQAKGRAGRTACGFYIPVSFNNEYEILEPWPQPAILREPITHVVLKIIAARLSIHQFDFIDKPSEKHLLSAVKRLQQIGAITTQESLTEVGQSLMRIPLNPEHAVILITANKFEMLAEALIVTASLETEGCFDRGNKEDLICFNKEDLQRYLPDIDLTDLPEWIKKQGRQFQIICNHQTFPQLHQGARWIRQKIRTAWAGKTGNDFAAIVRAYRAFKKEEQNSYYKSRHRNWPHAESSMKAWCRARGLHFKNIQLMEEKIQQVVASLQFSDIHFNPVELTTERYFDEQALLKSILSGKVDYVGHAVQYSAEAFSSKLGSFSMSYSSACSTDSKWVLISGLRKIHIAGRRGQPPTSRLIANCAAPIQVAWFKEVMPYLCHTQRDGDYAWDADQQRVTACESDYFNDLFKIEERTVVVPEDQLIKEDQHDNYYDGEVDKVFSTEIIYSPTKQRLYKRKKQVKSKAASIIISHWLTEQLTDRNIDIKTANAELNAVLEHNIEHQRQSETLNHRAGAIVFNICSYEQWYYQIESLILNIDRLSVLSQDTISRLKLPPLHQELVNKVHLDNPDCFKKGTHSFKVHYRGIGVAPQVWLKEGDLQSLECNLLDGSWQLPGGRCIELRVVQSSGQEQVITWNTTGHLNLAGLNISKLQLIDPQLFGSIPLNSEKLSKLPYFLTDSAICDSQKLCNELDVLGCYTIAPDQLRFIQWSLLMQIRTCVNQREVKIYQSLLMNHPLMQRRDYLSGMEVITGFFGSFFSRPSIAMDQTISTTNITDFVNHVPMNVRCATLTP